MKYFSYFSQKTGFDISCKLSPMQTICMRCQILFPGKNKKNIINFSSAEVAERVVKVNFLDIVVPQNKLIINNKLIDHIQIPGSKLIFGPLIEI